MNEDIEPLERALWSLLSASNNTNTNAPIRWDVINKQLAAYGAPTLGDDNEEDDGSYKAFAARWDDPEEGETLKRFVDRFDGDGVVLKTNSTQPHPQQRSNSQGNAVDKMAKRATQKAFK